MSFNVAIDGPAGAGKSTIAKAVAAKMHLIYVDTGAMYRAMGLYMIRNNVPADDTAQIINMCESTDITIEYKDGVQVVLLNGENVNPFIRNEEVGNMASKVSAISEVRTKLVNLQQKLAETADVIMDGRDIGTVVLPNADIKIYLTASVSKRAERRYKELLEKGETPSIDKIKADIEERDYRDMHREVSPLKQALDAILVDTSDMNLEESVEHIFKMVSDYRAEK